MTYGVCARSVSTSWKASSTALFGDEEAIELPERAHEALENLREINAMLHGIVELLGRQPAPSASADDVAGTLRNVRELSRIAEQELHAVILACTRARQHRWRRVL